MKKDCAIILAAGDGVRMKSSKPKVLAEVLFKPMLDWVLDRTIESGIDEICVVTGHMSQNIEERLDKRIKTVMQKERLGTGHAVLQAKDFISDHGDANVLVLAGDTPLVDAQTISAALHFHKQSQNSATIISARLDNPHGYGRIVRDDRGWVMTIVEEREATDEQKEISEVNSGAYWFNAQALLIALEQLEKSHDILVKNREKEIYLTDTIEILRGINMDVTAFGARTPNIVLGANDRVQLAQLNTIARDSELDRHRQNGVSIPISDGIIIGPDAEIGEDSLILPGTIIRGQTKIGKSCLIGPNSYIEDSQIEDNVELNNTQCRNSRVGEASKIGPFVQLRPGSVVAARARVGNFVEIKNSNIGTDAKISHLTYVGDSDLGDDVNLGCGTVTVNFDGKTKNRTTIEDGAFVGCNSNLIAPVTIGKNAFVAAGSTITKDVPADSLAIARARQDVKKGWVISKKPYKRQYD